LPRKHRSERVNHSDCTIVCGAGDKDGPGNFPFYGNAAKQPVTIPVKALRKLAALLNGVFDEEKKQRQSPFVEEESLSGRRHGARIDETTTVG
jgi:hypothetical protein